MTVQEIPPEKRLCGRQRHSAILLGVGFLGPLILAAFLHPDQRGHGTHQQLGLPPCTFEVLFGKPCPSCGATTAFAYVVRGRLCDALRSNVGGTLLAGLFAVTGPWLLFCAARGRWYLWIPTGPQVGLIAAAIAIIMVIGWIVRLC